MDWFYNGSHGKWAGYGIGYELVKKVLFKDGFDLSTSIKTDFSADNRVHEWLKTHRG